MVENMTSKAIKPFPIVSEQQQKLKIQISQLSR